MDESKTVKSEEAKAEQAEQVEQSPEDGGQKEEEKEQEQEHIPEMTTDSIDEYSDYERESEHKEVEEDAEFFAEKVTIPQTVVGEYMPERDDTSLMTTRSTLEDQIVSEAKDEEEQETGEPDSIIEENTDDKARVTISEPDQEENEAVKEKTADADDESEKKANDVADLTDDETEKMIKERPSTAQKSVTISESPSATIKRLKPKKSMRPQARSIVYDVKPRFQLDEEDLHRPSGDFGLASEQDADASMKFYVYMDDDAGEEEEKQDEEEEEEIVRIDREPYYVRHVSLNHEIRHEKIRSCILQKKLSYFFKRRNMGHVLRETDQQYDTQLKYGKKLDMYGELVEVDSTQRDAITQELDVLKEKREREFNQLSKLFNDMQEREKEIGKGLINKKTGNPIPDKLIERHIRRQKILMEEVSSMRLKFLQLKEMVAEKENAIAALDQIGEGLHLRDYEQLKVENRSHADKIEEKEEELTRLRFKCQNTIQILAHIREKSSALDSDIDDIKEEMSMVELQNLQVRGQLNGAKQERDHYRLMTNKLREESGLLTEPELLRDMESSMEELKTLSVELENLKEENKKKAQQIRNIRRNLEFTSDDLGLRKKSLREIIPKSVVKKHVYKGRPDLYKPSLPQNAFNFLKDFKPKVRMIKNKKK